MRTTVLVVVALMMVASGGSKATAQTPVEDTLKQSVISDSAALAEIGVALKEGRFAQAEGLSRALLAKVEGEHGPESLEAADVLDMLVESMWRGGKAAEPEAEVLARRALSIKEKALGQEHPNVFASVNNLAVLFKNQRKYADAEPLYRRALAIREKALGPENPDVAAALNSLAILYGEQGKYAEAEPLFRRALAIREKAQGTEHPDVATSMVNLAGLFSRQAKYADAEPLYRRALAIREKALGPEHPDVAATMSSLAVLFSHQAKYVDAEPLYRRAITIREKALGPEHPDVMRSLNNLATLLKVQGKYADAEPLYRRAQAIWEKALGPEHPDVASGLIGLANLYTEQGKYADAEPLYQRALSILEKALGPEHPDVAKAIYTLAILYYEQGKYADAERLYQRTLAIREKALGPEHPDVAKCLNGLAVLYYEQGKYADAEPLCRRALSIQETALGPENVDVARMLVNLALLQFDQGKYADAEPLLARAHSILEKALGAEHPHVASSLNFLANLYFEQGKYADAETLYVQALAIWERAFGPEHHEVAFCVEDRARLYALTHRPDLALADALQACRIRQKDLLKNGLALSDRDALTYSTGLRKASDLFLTLYLQGGAHGDTWLKDTWDVILGSKGAVTEGVFARRRAWNLEAEPLVLALRDSLRTVRFLASQEYAEGPGDDQDLFRRRIDSLEQRGGDLEARLSQASPRFRQELEASHPSVSAVAGRLPEGSVLIEIVRFNEVTMTVGPNDSTRSRYAVAVMGRSGELAIRDLGDAAPIDSLVVAYRAHFREVSTRNYLPAGEDKEKYNLLAKRLYEKILTPVQDHRDGRMLLIAPDAALNLVSFAGLIDEDGKYLVEKYAIHYLGAGRDLFRLEGRVESGRGLLAMGDPDFDARCDGQLAVGGQELAGVGEKYRRRNARSGCGDLADMQAGRLSFTRTEVQGLANLWREREGDSVLLYLDAAASEDVFKEVAPGRRAIHLATHGYFLEGRCQSRVTSAREFVLDEAFVGENPLLLSGLLFAGSNGHGVGCDSLGLEDGVLSALEVSDLDLTGTDLVVLSACETGLGEVEAGEGVYGLRRAFQMAGARTVVSALWPVLDEATAEMMKQLYTESGKPLYERMTDLQRTQIKKLRKRGQSDHPYSWAGFVALGDWK